MKVNFDKEYEHIHIGLTVSCWICNKQYSVDIEYLDRDILIYDADNYLYYKAPCPFCGTKHEVIVDEELNINVLKIDKWEEKEYDYEKDEVVSE